MVCLDAFTHKAKPVNPLIPVTEDEKALYAMGKGTNINKQGSGRTETRQSDEG